MHAGQLFQHIAVLLMENQLASIHNFVHYLQEYLTLEASAFCDF